MGVWSFRKTARMQSSKGGKEKETLGGRGLKNKSLDNRSVNR